MAAFDFLQNVGIEIASIFAFFAVLLILAAYLTGTDLEGIVFLRVVRAAGGKGVTHAYVRVVEAFRQNGKTRHRTVLNLGRRDLLAAHLDVNKLMRLLHAEAAANSGSLREDSICAVAAWDWGPMLVAGHCGANSAWRRRSTGSPRPPVARPRH
jgi:hypothetical protein